MVSTSVAGVRHKPVRSRNAIRLRTAPAGARGRTSIAQVDVEPLSRAHRSERMTPPSVSSARLGGVTITGGAPPPLPPRPPSPVLLGVGGSGEPVLEESSVRRGSLALPLSTPPTRSSARTARPLLSRTDQSPREPHRAPGKSGSACCSALIASAPLHDGPGTRSAPPRHRRPIPADFLTRVHDTTTWLPTSHAGGAPSRAGPRFSRTQRSVDPELPPRHRDGHAAGVRIGRPTSFEEHRDPFPPFLPSACTPVRGCSREPPRHSRRIATSAFTQVEAVQLHGVPQLGTGLLTAGPRRDDRTRHFVSRYEPRPFFAASRDREQDRERAAVTGERGNRRGMWWPAIAPRS